MSLLQIVQSAAVRFGLSSPNSAASNTDLNIQQIVALVNEEGQELAARASWQELTRESSFTTVAAEAQGSITTLAGSDFSFVLNETMWNRTQRRPLFGPKSPAQWQQLQAQFVQGPWQQYRIRGNQVLFIPAPAAGQLVYFEWVSKNWATDSTGATGKTSMTADTDIGVLDERLITLGAIWRFKAAKKFDYAEDFQKYEQAVEDALARNSSKPRLNLAGTDTDYYPGVFVSAGNWMVP